jgi:hypothetical protein
MTQVRRRTVVYLRHQLGALSLIVACALLALTACGSFPVFGKKESQRTKLIGYGCWLTRCWYGAHAMRVRLQG